MHRIRPHIGEKICWDSNAAFGTNHAANSSEFPSRFGYQDFEAASCNYFQFPSIWIDSCMAPFAVSECQTLQNVGKQGLALYPRNCCRDFGSDYKLTYVYVGASTFMARS